MSAIIFQRPRQIIGATSVPVAGTKLILGMSPSGRCDQVTATSGFTAGGADGGDIHFVPIPAEDAETISLQWEWFDAVTSVSAAVIQACNRPGGENDLSINDYDDSPAWTTLAGVTVTGPAASAAASEMIEIPASAHRRLRLRFVANAAGDMMLWSWGKD